MHLGYINHSMIHAIYIIIRVRNRFPLNILSLMLLGGGLAPYNSLGDIMGKQLTWRVIHATLIGVSVHV